MRDWKSRETGENETEPEGGEARLHGTWCYTKERLSSVVAATATSTLSG